MKIITITGTKGKTTVTRALSYLIRQSGKNTLRVDTDGHYINEKQASNLEESKKLFGLLPTVCPGKYLLAMHKYYPEFVAILETAIGSSRRAGLGYRNHHIGIFTNVLEDHLGVTKRLRSRNDIAKAKNFIFSALGEKGFAIFNADDKRVCSQLKFIPEKQNVTLIPVGYRFNFFNIKKHLISGGKIICVEENYIVLKSKNKTKKLLNLRDIVWSFNGAYKPSVYNLMFAIGGFYAFNKGNISQKNIAPLKNYRLDAFGGRLTVLENKNKVKIIIDFAHEKYSLREVAALAKKLSKNKTIGILRLAPDRTDKMISETGRYVANCFDNIIIYDKIDGINKKKYISRGLTPTRNVGDVSKLLFKGVLSVRKKGGAERIIIEEYAIKKASEIARPGDVVIAICGDDHKRTIGYIKKYFGANFV